MVSIPPMNRLGFVSGQFHPEFRGNARVGQHACERVAERMEGPFGNLALSIAFRRARIQAGFPHDSLESFAESGPAAPSKGR